MHNINQQLFFLINGSVGYFTILDGVLLSITTFFVPILVTFTLVWFGIVEARRMRMAGGSVLDSYRDVGVLSGSLVLVWSVVQSIKALVAFPRPAQFLEGVRSLSSFGDYDSFPSGHTALAFAIATFVYHYSKPTGRMLFLVAVTVGISRIFVGVHFPIDVFVGALLGIGIPRVIILFARRYT